MNTDDDVPDLVDAEGIVQGGNNPVANVVPRPDPPLSQLDLDLLSEEERKQLIARVQSWHLNHLLKKADEVQVQVDDEASLIRGTPRLATSSYKPKKAKKKTPSKSKSKKVKPRFSDDNSSSEDDSSDESDSSSESESSDSDDFARFFNVERRASKRSKRKSVIQKLSEDADNPKTKIMITQSPPPYSDIKLDSLTVTNVLRFIERVHNYQMAYRCPS